MAVMTSPALDSLPLDVKPTPLSSANAMAVDAETNE
jgi:hypothetical protein